MHKYSSRNSVDIDAISVRLLKYNTFLVRSILLAHYTGRDGVIMRQIIIVLETLSGDLVPSVTARASYAAFLNRCRRNGNILSMDQEIIPWFDGGQPITPIRMPLALLEQVYRDASAGGLCPATIKNDQGELIAVGVGPYAKGAMACALACTILPLGTSILLEDVQGKSHA